MTTDATSQKREQADFRRSISRKLAVIMASLFLLVVVAGGISLHLTYSNYVNTEEIRKERERLDLLDQMHYTIHHFVSDLQRAIIKGVALPNSERTAYLEQLQTLLELYHRSGAGEKEAEEKIPVIVTDLASLSKTLAHDEQDSSQLPALRASPRDIERLVEAEQTMKNTAHGLSIRHRAGLAQKVWENRQRIKAILGLYVAFIFGGALLILATGFFFSRAIARPIRRLAQSASEIARGNLHERVPVTSNDEIGQLSRAFNVMVDRLGEYQERLKVMATEEERERIAQELHDKLAQDLGLLHLQLAEAERSLSSKKSAETKERLREMRKVTDRAYEDVRQAIFGLRTMVSKGLGLIPTLTEYLHDFSEVRKIPVDLKIHGAEAIPFSPQAEVQLIRIIHEALTNVFKHAQAAKGLVRFERDGGVAKVTIEDDGKGFIVEQAMANGFHFGLQMMKERAAGVNGKLDIESAPGRGTRIIVHLPLAERPYETHPAFAGR